MPPRPDTPYTGVQSVLPETQAPNDFIRTEASPASFGGLVAAGAQKLGADITQQADQFQGMINKSYADNADSQGTVQINSILNQYKQKEGLDAVHSYDDVAAQIAAVRQNIVKSLPNPAAATAFNTLFLRREAYALGDAQTYAASQGKQAAITSASATVNNAVSEAATAGVAQDDMRFGSTIGDIKHGITSMLALKGYGDSMKIDPATGQPTFDETTPGGQSAKQVYDQEVAKATGQAWSNRIKSLSEVDINHAQSVFDANKSNIPPEAQLEIGAYLAPKARMAQANGLAGTALSGADQAYQGYVTSKVQNEPVTARPSVDAITNAISTQESGGNPNAPVSANGAVGKYQIKPDTFAQYARPGEVIGSAADNEAVGKRIIADYTQKYQGDPARVAVAYFSGPGNVAPPNSPTPWVNDAKDANGKSVSSYVSDVLGHMGGAGGVQTKADFYKQNYQSIIDNARTTAEQQHLGDATYADLAVARTQQQLDATIKQQDIAYGADRDTVLRAANGDFSKNAQPQTVDQLRATSPEVALAWDRLAAQQPDVAHSIATRVLTQTASGRDMTDYGAGAYSVFQRIHAAPDDPNRITSDTQLYGLVGQPNGLSMAGLNRMRQELAEKNTPEGDAEGKMREQLFKTAYGTISGKNDILGMKDPKGDENYLRFMAAAYPAIDQMKAQGKSPAQIYNPSSPDYVGKIIPSFTRNPAQMQHDLMAGNPLSAPPDGGQKFDLTKPEGVIEQYKSLPNPTRYDYDLAVAHLRALGVKDAGQTQAAATPAAPSIPTD